MEAVLKGSHIDYDTKANLLPTTIPNRCEFRRRSKRESFIIPLQLIEAK